MLLAKVEKENQRAQHLQKQLDEANRNLAKERSIAAAAAGMALFLKNPPLASFSHPIPSTCASEQVSTNDLEEGYG